MFHYVMTRERTPRGYLTLHEQNELTERHTDRRQTSKTGNEPLEETRSVGKRDPTLIENGLYQRSIRKHARTAKTSNQVFEENFDVLQSSCQFPAENSSHDLFLWSSEKGYEPRVISNWLESLESAHAALHLAKRMLLPALAELWLRSGTGSQFSEDVNTIQMALSDSVDKLLFVIVVHTLDPDTL